MAGVVFDDGDEQIESGRRWLQLVAIGAAG